MELTVYWTQLAEDKLEDIFHYYKYKASKRVAADIINGIIDSTNDLEKTPEIGQKEFLLKEREQDFRYLIFKNYKIIYWINKNQQRIEITNVFDTRQNPEKINQTK
ncbi:type II toxin-antitoxin system RelE/ParE family toxin [Christiangramia fulva]|uniref:Type II toxin-antitoxin system RelE/ParE family toxin n=1 Tax=Christiangramia fulva TaxID=2126553 RepID=A0A2R3Z5X6_9FLAO|nr:type II toxin-antitoxin system RelE/ParE family toxin [Christiangramia fulva]AVR45676.1 type II toxin-antitoxin system RelE/ParE family toxin [Christiangramia fulva]